jgi:excisionase family DNA binding protein
MTAADPAMPPVVARPASPPAAPASSEAPVRRRGVLVSGSRAKRPEIAQRLLSEIEAARYLGIGCRTLRTWRALGRVHAVRIKGGRTVRYDLLELDALIAEGKDGS